MPQMSPINWLFLYMLFTMIFLIFNFFNYYLFLFNKKNILNKNFKFKFLNWKW